eukprot:TRINITY_DN65785_c0_g1_i1.p2 TRINITY_DN65785_c0_g1~~TRINITY_DN65785_c0_g1_i1.p2  ORF type:complete len:243 (+),score=26.17 TRINITY_DN65785_c0_g1_i1:79-807(+)
MVATVHPEPFQSQGSDVIAMRFTTDSFLVSSSSQSEKAAPVTVHTIPVPELPEVPARAGSCGSLRSTGRRSSRGSNSSSSKASEGERRADSGCAAMKVCFALLSLWPPWGFVIAEGEIWTTDGSARMTAFWITVIPLLLGVALAFAGLTPCCLRHPQSSLRRLLFASDVVLAFATSVAGVVVIGFFVTWNTGCDAGDEYECGLRAVALRVIVDVFGMAMIHGAAALAMLKFEDVLGRSTPHE